MATIRLYCKGINMTRDHIDEIYDFNKTLGLLDSGYDDFLESSFQIEEALEGFDLLYFSKELLSEFTAPRSFSSMNPKEVSRAIVKSTGEFQGTDVDRLDKAIDAIVFAVGSIAKLRLTPSQIREAISVVTKANLQKLGMPKDEFGKVIKPDNFVGPEVELQKILDSRNENV